MTGNHPDRLPDPPERQMTEPLLVYGSRVLQFLLATSCTAVLTTSDLELADHVAIVAVSSHDVSQQALQAITDARHLIAVVLKGRQANSVAVPILQAAAPLPTAPHNGPSRERVPSADRPFNRPPSGQKVEIAF